MEFQKQQITIPLRRRNDNTVVKRDVEVVVGIGSGLAYHQPFLTPEDEEFGSEQYTLTHIASGLALPCRWYVETEAEARRWLELAAELADWAMSQKQILQSVDKKDIQQQIEDALTQACDEIEEQVKYLIEGREKTHATTDKP